MAVERLTDYTRRIWTALGPDDPAGHDIHVNDVIYYMDSSECCIVTNVYPDGSIDCETLPDVGGGGGGDYVATDWVVANKPVGPIVSDATNLVANALQNRTQITDVVLTEATSIPDGFATRSSITSLTAPKLTSIGSSFQSTTQLTTPVFIPNVILYTQCFEGSRIPIIVCKGCNSSWSAALKNNPNLTAVDFVNPTNMGVNTFANCTSFNILICRGETVAAMSGISTLSNTPFASGKAGGTLYVPQDMITAYQNATNWSTILAYPNNQILPIEGSIYETQYADGTPIP